MKPDEFKQHLRMMGVSQRDFAAETGVSVSTVNKWAKGRAGIPPMAAAYVRLRLDRMRDRVMTAPPE